MRFEIHSHSEYSSLRLLDAICHPKDLIKTAYDLGLAGITLTDHETVSGHIDFLDAEKELKSKNIISQDFKIGLGNEIYLVDSRENINKYWHCILIAKDTKGHEALRKLSSIAWYNAFYAKGMQRVPTTKTELKAICEEYPNSLIISSACLGSEVAHLTMELISAEKTGDEQLIYECKKQLLDLINYFKSCVGNDDFYLEVAPSSAPEQKKYNRKIFDIAKKLNIKVVFGGDAHYLTAKDRPIHKAVLNSKNGEREVDDFYYYAYLMDDEEAFKNCGGVFTKNEFDEICQNSLDIQNKIGEYNLFRQPIIPTSDIPCIELNNTIDFKNYPTLAYEYEHGTPQARYWTIFCLNKLKDINLNNSQYLSRLETEADVIQALSEKMDNDLFAYFTTFQSYIDLFWENGSIVGPGRGSSVAFLSNYLLGITQLDPIKNNLDYWRFLNKERAELPDIDIDLTPSKRETIFKAIRQKIGETKLLQVATFSTAGTRQAILIACRGYRGDHNEYPDGIDVDIAQYMTSLVPQERGFLWPLNDVIYGNQEKDRQPIQAFTNTVNQYAGLLELMLNIEGLIIGHSQHASGVIIYNQPCYKTGALMRSPTGALTTQYELHQGERLGDTKFDFLVTEICDKITTAIKLLQEDNLLPEGSLREIYNNFLHPDKLNLNDARLWDALAAGTVMDVFQFSTAVGLHAAQTIKPRNPIEMMMANALTRLAGEKGKEAPIDRYVRLKNDISQWYSEMREIGLTEEEIKIIEPYYLPASGCPTTQEKLMLLCMDKDIANFSLAEANTARKICAKKKLDQVASLKEKFINACPRELFGRYVWATAIEPQMSYSFAEPHALAYSYVGIQVLYLATNFNPTYWNCACLISNAGGEEGNENDDVDIYVNDLNELKDSYYNEMEEFTEDDESEVEDSYDEGEDCDGYPVEVKVLKTGEKKKKTKTVNYGKISSAIGKIKSAGVIVVGPDINKSTYTFSPDVDNNTIRYGLSGITRIGEDLVKEIIAHRPYKDWQDFLNKVKINKPQMVNLIKSGAFDEFGERNKIMFDYINSICDKKKRITLQNMKMLIDFNLFPDDYDMVCRVYNFTKYLKRMKQNSTYYLVDKIAFSFLENYFSVDELEICEESESGFKLNQNHWDKIYQKYMNKARDYIKTHNLELLETINNKLFNDMWNKYCNGSYSKWEMDSVSFYEHRHELEPLYTINRFDNFEQLTAQPQIEKMMTFNGKAIPIFKLARIAGTVLDRNKAKKTITLLTDNSVITVKIYGNTFAQFDKQISERGADGKKHVIDKSWFARGTKLIITGVRQDDGFLAKKYSKTPYPLIEKIVDINGSYFTSINERPGVEK